MTVPEPTLEQVREMALKRTYSFKPGTLTKRRGPYLLKVGKLLDALVAEGTLMYADSPISGRWYYPPNHPTRRRGAEYDNHNGLRLLGATGRLPHTASSTQPATTPRPGCRSPQTTPTP